MAENMQAPSWRTVRSPRYGEGIRRLVDLSHELYAFPGRDPQIPPPAFPHIEPFGQSIADRARAFDHVRIEPFHFSDSAESRSAMVTICTQMDPQLEGPYLGYLPAHLYGELDPKLKLVPKDPANAPLAQLVTNCAIIDRPTGPGESIWLRDIQEKSAHVQPGDAVLLRTGFLDQHADSFQWPSLEPGITDWLAKEKGCLLFGIDSGSVEGSLGGHLPIPNHLGMMMVGGINLEGLCNIGAIPTPRCYLVAVPLRVFGLDAGPCRALAIFEQDGERRIADLSPVIRANAGPMLTNPDFGACKTEPFEDKNAVTRRLRIDPFHVDTCFDDLGMFVTFNTHLGSHVEIPVGPETPDVASFPIERLSGPAVVLDVPVGPGGQITAALLEQSGPSPAQGDVALVRTGYSDWNYGRPDFYDRSPSFAPDAVAWLIDRGISVLASDCAAVDAQRPLSGTAPDRSGVTRLLTAGMPVVSNVTHLDQIFAPRPFVVFAPLRLAGINNCPVRAVAIEWE